MNFLKSLYHYFLAFFGAVIYCFPSKKIFVLGVTGTKGKSTTLEIISSILEEAGYSTAISSSVRFKIGRHSEENLAGNTMPGRFALHKFLHRAVSAQCKYALIEVTSQGILQNRHRFIDFSAAMFLNLHKEHIEAHGGFGNYREAKLDFFRYVAKNKNPKQFFINIDDENSSYFKNVAELKENHQVYFFSADIVSTNKYDFYEPKLLDFYKENLAAAITFAKSQNISKEFIKQGILKFKGVSGRMEIIQKEPFFVIIDYAHTPDSLEKVYKSLKEKFKPSKMICVLGSAGGGRDKWKRPVMGEIAAKYCAQIILTNEDPYDEIPLDIIRQIENGISQASASLNVYKILDRREAIKYAISFAKNGDVVILTGKGSEKWIHVANGKKIPWDERMVVEKFLATENFNKMKI